MSLLSPLTRIRAPLNLWVPPAKPRDPPGLSQAETRLKRWLVLPICLGLAAVAGYVLLSGGPVRQSASRQPPPHSEIRQESKDELVEILREADRDELLARDARAKRPRR